MASVIFTAERGLLALGVLAACVLIAAPALAADTNELQGETTIFISPAGEPFQSPMGDAYPIVKWFDRMDKKGDGKVTLDEFEADALYVFNALDRNHDLMLDSSEILAYEQYVVPIITKASPDSEFQDPSKLMHDQGAAYYGLFQEPEPITAADRNFDFKISRQEFLDQADRHFKTLDKGAKGYIVLDDLPKTAAEKAARATRVAKAGTVKPVAPAAAAGAAPEAKPAEAAPVAK